jgi:Flp pilus assembly protein TadG
MLLSGLLQNRRLAALSRLLKDRRGGVAPMFALCIVPIVGFTGAAVDYSRANAIRTSLQAASDATSLAMSKLAPTLTDSQLQTQTIAYFRAIYNNAQGNTPNVTAVYTNGGGNGSSLTLTASASMNTAFMSYFGIANMTVGTSSMVKWGNTRLRVALVLDNTGSMAQSSKMSALKTATTNLLTQLRNAATNNGDVYVSIIPFVKDVNVDSSNYTANWVDWTDWDLNNGSCNGVWNSGWYDNKSACQNAGGNWNTANHNSWNGCIVDRGNSNGPNSNNYDTNVTAPVVGTTATMFAAEQYGSCPQAIMPLSYNWTQMNTLVNNMSPAGNTNQGIGLVHGWMSLVGGGPYGTVPAMDPNYRYSQVIILLTDGLNTQNRWYTSQNSIDTRQQMTCNNIKAAGVTLYTIQVNTGGDPTSTLLQNCASDSSKFFLLTSANEIVTTFNQIATNLTALRIAR